jgi:hypothetical protein
VTMGRRVLSVAALTDDDARVADPPDARLRDMMDIMMSSPSNGVMMMCMLYRISITLFDCNRVVV